MIENFINAGLPCAAGALFTALLATIKGKHKMQKNLERGILVLLHYCLYAECERIIKTKKYTKDDLRDLTHLYEVYHSLGGNGTGTRLYQAAVNQKMEVEK